MSQVSYLAMALGVLNLLLVASALLLVCFDWSAARRREFLYLFFTEERPGFSYFAAARRRRAQYSRFIVALFILFMREFLAAVQYAAVSKPGDWANWVRWWGSNWWQTQASTPATSLASDLQIWIATLGLLGLALLALAFLYRPQKDRLSFVDLVAIGFIAIWGVLPALIVTGSLGGNAVATVNSIASIARIVVVAVAVLWFLRRRDDDLEPGLLNYDSGIIALAFVLWIGGIIAGDWLAAPAIAPVIHVGAYVLMVATIARGVLNEYETVEGSRHRLGRERQVIVSFLQRIGSAFTTEVAVDDVLKIILDSSLETTEAQAGAIYLYSQNEQVLEPRIVSNFFPPMYVDTPAAYSAHRTDDLEDEMKHQSFALGQGIIGEVAANGKAQIVDDVAREGIMLGSTTDYMRNRSMLVVPLRIRDEPLGVMAVLNKGRGSFNNEDRSLLQALADQGALFINNAILTSEVAEQERLRRDLQIARDIQQRLLPDKCPVVPGFEIAARGTAATEVGGDYYDFFWVDDDHLGIVVADVSGKGVHAALIAAMIRSAFRTEARGNPDVRSVLTGVNEFISQDLRSDMFITCVYGILEISTRRFSWARAGHEPIIVAHSEQETEVISPDGFALGVVDSPDFGELLQIQTTELHSGDRVLIFTDGLTEAMNSDGEEFGMERVLELMNHADSSTHLNGNSKLAVAAPVGSTSVGSTSTGSTPVEKTKGKKAEEKSQVRLTGSSPCAPEASENEPEDLKIIERAVAAHVGAAPQSDDLTIVYLSAK
jgi:sigma-B regulation protein RsbU (phosphoserine phosphatase)